VYYLVRHGIADPGVDDRRCPLIVAGQGAVEQLAYLLAARGVEVVEIRHSGAWVFSPLVASRH
jgi:phosphohistidine phosphatase SixA